MIGRLSGNRPASQQRGRIFMISLGLIGLVFSLALVLIGFNAPNSIPGRSYYNIDAQFRDADNIANHGQVRIGGKIVGQALDLRVRDGFAVVQLQIDPEHKPLKSDTRIEVRPRSPVGVRYIDIIPGTKGKDLPEDGMIPASNTDDTRTLDEVLGTLDPVSQRRAGKFLRGIGTGFAGRGDDLNESIGAGPEFLRGTDQVLGEIARREGAIRSLIRGGATAAAAADPVRDDIRDGFEPQAQALRPFHEAETDLHAFLETAGRSLPTIQSGLARTDPFVRNLRSFSAEARRLFAVTPESLSQTSALLRESRPGLRDTDDTLRRLGRAVNPTLGLLREVDPVLPRLNDLFGDSRPLVKHLGPHSCDVKLFGDRWGSILAYGNQDGGYLRFNLITPGPEAVFGLNGGERPFPTFDNPYPAPCTTENERSGR